MAMVAPAHVDTEWVVHDHDKHVVVILLGRDAPEAARWWHELGYEITVLEHH